MSDIVVEHARGSYRVVLAESFRGIHEALDEALGEKARRLIVVTDEVVGPLWADALESEFAGIQVARVVLPAGEVHKTLETWQDLIGRMLEQGVDRKTPVVALGGGVVGDMAGFAAACTMRGLPYVQVPTTLLAMVDSSVGGKTAVNHARGKNLVGAFHAPQLVWASIATLSTLPVEELTTGLGEVVKSAALGDPELLTQLYEEPLDLREVVARCVRVKAAIVAQDEEERGVRAILNAGHTVGHALETALGHGVLRHGHAVAIGLVLEAAFAVREGICTDPSLPRRLADVAAHLGLPVTLPDVSDEALAEAVRLDKKGRLDTLAVPLPVRDGVYTVVSVPWRQVPDLWKSAPS